MDLRGVIVRIVIDPYILERRVAKSTEEDLYTRIMKD